MVIIGSIEEVDIRKLTSKWRFTEHLEGGEDGRQQFSNIKTWLTG